MIVCGGLCFLVMYILADMGLSLIRKIILSAGFITTVEYFVGLIVNLALKWDIWDYSEMPLNLLGQICLPFSLMWVGLSLPGLWLCGVLRRSMRRIA